jgi:hypothetical protein
MRRLLYPAISLVAAAAFAAPALAHSPRHHGYVPHHYHTRAIVHPGYRDYAYAPAARRHNGARVAAPVAGVAAGTTVGVGVAEGWGTAAATAALPATTAGAAAVGGAAGMGAVAAVDAMLEPCRGLAAVFNLSQGECQGGHYVGSPENNLTPWNRQRR